MFVSCGTPLEELTLELRRIAISKIVEDPDQPRKAFDETGLAGLAESLRQHGVLNPITVVALSGVDAYRIVTGERRWRASQLAGLDDVPCLIRKSDTVDRRSEQLIENLQREDLAPVDKANAIKFLKEEIKGTNKEVAQRLGLSDRMVGHLLDLLDLPEAISEQVVSSPNRPADGQITEKHARFLRQLNEEPELQNRVVEKVRGEKLSSDDTARVARAVRDFPELADRILDADVSEIPVITGRIPTSTGPTPAGAMLGIAERIIDALAEIRIERLDAMSLENLEKKLGDARLALDRKLVEVRAAQRSETR